MMVRYRRPGAVLALAGSLVLAAAAIAVAAAPRPGATYAGKVKERLILAGGQTESAGSHPVRLTTSGDGSQVAHFRATYRVSCHRNLLYTTDQNIPIVDGRFHDHGHYTTQHIGLKNHVRLGGKFTDNANAARVHFRDTFNPSSNCAALVMSGVIQAK